MIGSLDWLREGLGMGMGSCGGGFGWMGLGMLFNFLLGLGLLALVVVAVIVAVRWLVPTSDGSPRGRSRDDALEIVRTRYARGEISRDEFDRLQRELA
jgi:putative membrane protein